MMTNGVCEARCRLSGPTATHTAGIYWPFPWRLFPEQTLLQTVTHCNRQDQLHYFLMNNKYLLWDVYVYPQVCNCVCVCFSMFASMCVSVCFHVYVCACMCSSVYLLLLYELPWPTFWIFPTNKASAMVLFFVSKENPNFYNLCVTVIENDAQFYHHLQVVHLVFKWSITACGIFKFKTHILCYQFDGNFLVINSQIFTCQSYFLLSRLWPTILPLVMHMYALQYVGLWTVWLQSYFCGIWLKPVWLAHHVFHTYVFIQYVWKYLTSSYWDRLSGCLTMCRLILRSHYEISEIFSYIFMWIMN